MWVDTQIEENWLYLKHHTKWTSGKKRRTILHLYPSDRFKTCTQNGKHYKDKHIPTINQEFCCLQHLHPKPEWSVWDLSAVCPIQLPVKVLEKAVEDVPCTCTPVTREGDDDGVPRYWLQPGHRSRLGMNLWLKDSCPLPPNCPSSYSVTIFQINLTKILFVIYGLNSHPKMLSKDTENMNATIKMCLT